MEWQIEYNHDLCFFFHEEDGIRDLYVTGVQTCALPIYKDLGILMSVAREAGVVIPLGSAVSQLMAALVAQEIGRASCRERAEISGVGTLEQKMADLIRGSHMHTVLLSVARTST